jgi:hypothetical protein
MIVRRQDLIDQFASNFRHANDGQILFQPPNAKVGVPITREEYQGVMAAFERRQMITMIITWALMLAAGAYGLHQLIMEDRYLPFFVCVGLAWAFSIMLNARDGLGLLLPFMRRRDEFLKIRAVGRRK